MKRRTFLQLSGMTAATALLAGCQSSNEKLITYLVPPDEGVTPGKVVSYASSCGSCGAGCGILVRVAEGRAKKIEGNPYHPVNRGKLCARGQAILQELYHPDRITQPLRRIGPRGSGKFARISWEEALGLLTGRLRELQQKRATGDLAIMTPQLTGSIADLVDSFAGAFGTARHVSFELLAPDWLRHANRQSFGRPGLPFHDLAETRYLLSFGADFVEHHLSPVGYANAFGRMRQGRDTVRGHFTYVGGRMSLTGASADRWLPTRPGSEGALALGMARLIVSESLFDEKALSAHGLRPDELLARLKGYPLEKVAGLTGLTAATIADVAREFATTPPALAMAGEHVAFQTNGAEAVRAIELLNLLAGSLNRPGGVYPAGTPGGKENSFAELLGLVEGMEAGKVGLALIKGDPVHSVPPVTGFRKALDKVPFIVSFPTLLDDTAARADLILPDHACLESWGDVIPPAGSRGGVYGTMQPVVKPLHDTRQFGDVLLAAASQLEGRMAAALPWISMADLVKQTARKRLPAGNGDDFESHWTELLCRGGLFESPPRQEPGYRWRGGAEFPDPESPRFAGERERFPLHLQLYPTIAWYDGRGAPLPWLQQLPDPMSTVVWDSWIEINPGTAASLGIGQGDLVEVTSPRGTVRLPAVIYPAIRPELVAIPLGQGHRDAGRYARGRGVNPLELLALPEGGEAAWGATRVRVTRVSAKGDLVTAGHPEGSYRSDLLGI